MSTPATEPDVRLSRAPDGQWVLHISLIDLYAAVVARLHHGDLANARKYARMFLRHPDLERARTQWIANAIAASRIGDLSSTFQETANPNRPGNSPAPPAGLSLPPDFDPTPSITHT